MPPAQTTHAATSPDISVRDAEALVSSWGFSTVFMWRDGANAHYPPHTHAGTTTHLILSGSMSIQYPGDAVPKRETYGPGDRLDVEGGRVHEVFMGGRGCGYVIGE